MFSRFAETLLVRVECESGQVGWGESQAGVAPNVVASIVDTILAPVLIGRDALDGSVLWDEMYSCMRDRGHGGGFMMDAIAAVDIALWDLAGKVYEEPVSRLLGGAYRLELPLYLSGPRGNTLEQRLADTERFVDEGFSAVKLFIGRGVEADVSEVGAFREHFGADLVLLVDAQWLYSPPEALRLGKALEELRVGFLETPINPEDISGHAELSRDLALPIALGETERTRWQFLPFLNARAVDVVQPDVGRCGITETRRIAFLAELHNLPVTFHCGVGFGPYLAATLQTAAAIPNLMYVEYQPDMHELARQAYGAEFVIRRGSAQILTFLPLGVAEYLSRARHWPAELIVVVGRIVAARAGS